MINPIVYAIHWLRREAAARHSPLTRLLFDSVLDGPRRSVEPTVYRTTSRTHIAHRGSRHRRPHSGPIRTLRDETFCTKCGVGVDDGGFYERAAKEEGMRLTEDDAAKQYAHYATEREAVSAGHRK